jgi:hypothetical protein
MVEAMASYAARLTAMRIELCGKVGDGVRKAA